jgi:truncated hemoglobin YjbI
MAAKRRTMRCSKPSKKQQKHTMHHVTPPTEQQRIRIDAAKAAADTYAQAIDALIPDNPHKVTVMRKLQMIARVIDEVITHT